MMKAKPKTGTKLISLNSSQITWLLEELDSILQSDNYTIDERVLAATLIKKLKGRGPSADTLHEGK